MDEKMKSVVVEHAKGLGIRVIELAGEALIRLAQELSGKPAQELSGKPNEVKE